MQKLKTARAPTQSVVKNKPRNQIAWIRLLLLGVILAAFGRIVANDFVDWDDGVLIYGNPNINPPTLTGLARHWNPRDKSNIQMYDPLVFTTWWILAHGAQLQYADLIGASLNPEIFHAANLLVHWLTACVVLEILRRIGFKPWPAAAGAIIFAIHPLQTEPVAWATAMKDVLSGFFVMLAIWRYLAAMEMEGRPGRIHYGIATFLFLCALLSKPSTVVAPLIVILLDILIFHRPWWPAVKRMSPWFAMSAAAMVLAKLIQSAKELTPVPLIPRPLIAADAIAFYLGKLVFPVGLTWDYGRSPLAVFNDPSLHHPLYWTWIFPVAVALVVWRSKKPPIWAAGLIFLAGVLPVLGLTSFVFQYYSTVADRYVYISMLGVAVAVAWVLSNYANRMVVGTFVAIVVALSCVSFTQAGYWKDHEAFSRRESELGVGNALHYLVLGTYKDRQSDIAFLHVQAAEQQGRTSEAMQWADEGRNDINEALDNFKAVIRMHPFDNISSGCIPVAYDHIRTDLIALGSFLQTQAMYVQTTLGRPDAALQLYQDGVRCFGQAIEITRQEMTDQNRIPQEQRTKPYTLHAELGMLYGSVHRYADEVVELKKSLELKDDPDLQKKLEEAEMLLAAATRPSTAPAK
jgi:hypothetical protein